MAAEDRDIISQAEDIYGQYLYAVGSGGGQSWIKRAAIRVVRERYFRSIVTAVKEGVDWDKDAPHVLAYLRTIGSLAASFALRDGRHSIGGRDMRQAIDMVESNYNITGPNLSPTGDPEPLGAWCPPPSGGG